MNAAPLPLTGQISKLLRCHRFRHSNEKQLQSGLEQVFRAYGLAFEREHELGEGSIVDFFFEGGVALEVKVDGSFPDVLRQLHRYAQFPAVNELVLVTSRARLAGLPEQLNAKPVTAITLHGGLL